MDPSTEGGARRSRKRGGGGRSNSQGSSGRQGGESFGRGGKRRKRGKRRTGPGQRTADRLPPTHKDDSSVLGGRVPRDTERRNNEFDGPPDGFGLFCACYLGVTPDDRYQKPSLEEAARRYQIKPDEVRTLLGEYRLDRETFNKCDYDLEGAKLDVQLAPEGISRIEIAREQYTVYLEALDTVAS
ncbi:MAG: hypothetical protein JRH20_16640 [Deltaproteobacteria bacterium]|nr:hypothetical protein [Deltaproteobacteria bacterium]